MHGEELGPIKTHAQAFRTASVRQCCYIWTEGIDTKAFWWPHAVFNSFRIILMRTLSLCFITRAEPVRWVLLIGQHQMDRFGCWLSATKFGADYQNSLVPKKVHQFEEVSISLVKYGIVWVEVNSPFVSILSSLSFQKSGAFTFDVLIPAVIWKAIAIWRCTHSFRVCKWFLREERERERRIGKLQLG